MCFLMEPITHVFELVGRVTAIAIIFGVYHDRGISVEEQALDEVVLCAY